MIEGLLLGVSTGGSCLAFCAPVLLPYSIGEGKKVTGNLPQLAVFIWPADSSVTCFLALWPGSPAGIYWAISRVDGCCSERPTCCWRRC